MYHYLAWATRRTPASRRGHVVAVTLYFFLGFMTKFVAALFLPVVLGAATLLHRETRTRVFGEWKLWAAGVALFFALAAPWFVYQQIVAGADLWRVMLGAHVVERFTVSIDPSHIQPWNFYYVTIFREMLRTGTVWLALGGDRAPARHGSCASGDSKTGCCMAWFVAAAGAHLDRNVEAPSLRLPVPAGSGAGRRLSVPGGWRWPAASRSMR